MNPTKEKSTAELFANYPIPKKTRKLNERQELICKICFELGIADRDKSGLYFQSLGIFTDQELLNLKDKALSWKTGNPAALFRKLVKEKRLQVKQQLDESQTI